MASSNADRVVMAAVPGFGFPVDAPNVATPRELTETETQKHKRLDEPMYYRTSCWLPASNKENNQHKNGGGHTKMAAGPRDVRRVGRYPEGDPVTGSKERDTNTKNTHTNTHK